MLEAIVIVCLVAILLLLLRRPRRDRIVRDVASIRNGHGWWRDKELY